MNTYAQNEVFIEKDGDLEFAHTKVILRENNRFFYATTRQRFSPLSIFKFQPLDLTEIPTDKIWPEIGPDFTTAPNPLPPHCHIKQPSLIDYGDTAASLDPGALLLQEAKIFEILKKHPHPNIAHFYGCIVQDKRLKGLCFKKYTMTLSQAVRESVSLGTDAILRGIEAGINHLHNLGLVHNDLNPSNIMIDGQAPVIIDFDSCKAEGTTLGIKGGTLGWDTCDTNLSERENDLKALLKIRAFLEQAQHCE